MKPQLLEEANMKSRTDNAMDRRGILKTSAAVLGGALLGDEPVETAIQNVPPPGNLWVEVRALFLRREGVAHPEPILYG